MTKSEIKSIMKQIERLKNDIGIGEKRQIEDLTEELILIYGMDYIDEVFHGQLGRIKMLSVTLKKGILFELLAGQNIRVRQTIIGYFLGTGEPTPKSFMLKFQEFQRVLTATETIKRKKVRNERKL